MFINSAMRTNCYLKLVQTDAIYLVVGVPIAQFAGENTAEYQQYRHQDWAVYHPVFT